MIFRGSRYTNTYGVLPYRDEEVPQQKMLFTFREYLRTKEVDLAYHKYRQGENFHALAATYYNNSNFFWAILEANEISSELELNPGDMLYIPMLEIIVAYVNSRDGAR